MTKISVTELARNLADVLNRAVYQGESFEIERSGRRLVLCAAPTVAPTVENTRDRVAVALAKYREMYPPGSDSAFAQDMARARQTTNALAEVSDPWAR